MPMTLPNLLTLLRVAAIPLLVVLFYFPEPVGTHWVAVLFAAAGITDWLDGYLARRSGQTSAFGAFLDPVADKLIVVVALVLLTERIDSVLMTLAACVVIGREVVVSALREWMAQYGNRASVAVTFVAKLKTVMQMVAITGLLWHAKAPATAFWRLVAEGLLLLAVILTLWSMVEYLKAFWRTVQSADGAD